MTKQLAAIRLANVVAADIFDRDELYPHHAEDMLAVLRVCEHGEKLHTYPVSTVHRALVYARIEDPQAFAPVWDRLRELRTGWTWEDPPCPLCCGGGEDLGAVCPRCRGTGRIELR